MQFYQMVSYNHCRFSSNISEVNKSFLADLFSDEDFLLLMGVCCQNKKLMSHTETYLCKIKLSRKMLILCCNMGNISYLRFISAGGFFFSNYIIHVKLKITFFFPEAFQINLICLDFYLNSLFHLSKGKWQALNLSFCF